MKPLTKPLTLSIRRQLLCWLLIPIMALWVAGSAITYILVVNFANDAYDSALLDWAHTVASRIGFGVARGLKPLRDLQNAVASRSPSDLRTLAVDATPKKAVDLNAIARDATRELVPQAIQKRIDLDFEGLPVERVVSGDAESLYEMASNLIENTILYMQEGGKVTVRLEDRSYPKLIIEDNGQTGQACVPDIFV